MGERAPYSIRSHLVECPACGAPNPTNAKACWHCERPTPPGGALPGDGLDGTRSSPQALTDAAARGAPAPTGARPVVGLRGAILAVAAAGGALALAFLMPHAPPSPRADAWVPQHGDVASGTSPASTPSVTHALPPPPAPAPAPPSTPSVAHALPPPPAPDPRVSAPAPVGVSPAEAQAAFGWSEAPASGPTPPAGAPPALEGCTAALATIGLCADARSPEGKP